MADFSYREDSQNLGSKIYITANITVKQWQRHTTKTAKIKKVILLGSTLTICRCFSCVMQPLPSLQNVSNCEVFNNNDV